MLRKVKIENYRCFEDTVVDFQNTSIIVGKNNAGKSTLIEILRIISVVGNRCNNLNYRVSPDWIDLQPTYVGVSPSLSNLDISTKNLFYMYGEPPAKITATFSNKVRFEIYLGTEAEIFAVIFDQNNKVVSSKHQANKLNLRIINVLPQISPIQREETVLKYATVHSGFDTYLMSRHFRNQIRYNYQNFNKFKDLSELTWKGLGISDLDGRTAFEGSSLTLIVRDGLFTAEIGWMGHGLQMWLQTMWFLARSNEDSIIILDEPDVYMHADLQRRLIRVLKGRYKQIMIATHSIEIMSEVEPENILLVDSTKDKLTYADKTPMVQQIIEGIGSVHNIEIVRIFSHKKFLIVEGDYDDTKILGILHDTLFQDSTEPIDTIPKTFIEGWGGWQRVIGSNKVFKDTKLEIKTYCILDSDYHLQEDIEKRYTEANDNSINLHIWSKKEIENYLIIPKAIVKSIKNENQGADVDDDIVCRVIDNIVEEMKQGVTDDYATEISNKDKKLVIKTVNERAREIVYPSWNSNKLSLVPGKKLISKLSKWSQDNFNVSFNAFKLARNISKHEIDNEIVELLNALEKNENLLPLKSLLPKPCRPSDSK
ncbi:MAG: ATP-dependent endonuclease [Ignavibacteriales bacterium]|nr:MAG: ATP-dependent endonuclease [Ignavibacteriales bacterium]